MTHRHRLSWTSVWYMLCSSILTTATEDAPERTHDLYWENKLNVVEQTSTDYLSLEGSHVPRKPTSFANSALGKWKSRQQRKHGTPVMCSKGNQVNETPAEELENHSEKPNKNQENANQRLNKFRRWCRIWTRKLAKGERLWKQNQHENEEFSNSDF